MYYDPIMGNFINFHSNSDKIAISLVFSEWISSSMPWCTPHIQYNSNTEMHIVTGSSSRVDIT